MISYVLLIFITISLSIGVYIWLKDYAVINDKINCKDGTSLTIENYNIEEKPNDKRLSITIKNNGLFNISGFLISAGNNSKKVPLQLLWARFQIQPYPGYFDFEPELAPGEKENVIFNLTDIDKLEVIQVQPYIFKDNKNIDKIFCEQGLIKQVVLINPSLIPGLVSWWKFDGSVIDYGVGNDGTNNGASFDDGKVNQGLKFDGVNDYVEILNSGDLEPSDVTISMWFYADSWLGTIALIEKRTMSTNGYILFYHNGKLNVDWGGSANRWAIAGYAPPINEWTHIVYTFDNAASPKAKLYVNGDTQNPFTSDLGNSLKVVSGGKLRIGSDSIGGYYFDGLIDEPVIYNKALTDWEILQLYNSYNITS